MELIKAFLRVARVAGLALLVCVAACGGSDDVPAGEGAIEAPLVVVSSADQRYGALKSANGGTFEVFRNADGSVDQTSYVNPHSGEKSRVLYDADGLPQRLIDTDSGMTVVIERVSAARVDLRTYAPGGEYLTGYAVLSRSGGLFIAPITGTPSFRGQLSGQISGYGTSGSFALLPDDDVGLGLPVALTGAQLALVDALSGSDSGIASKLRGVTPSPFSKEAQLNATAAIDRRAVIGGLVAGVIVGVASGNPAAGLISGAMVAYGMQRVLLPIIDGVRAADTLEDLPNTLAPFLDGFHDGRAASDSVQASLAGGEVPVLRGILGRTFDAARDAVATLIDRTNAPAFDARPAEVSTPLTGVGVDQQGVSYNYVGNVAPGGSVTMTGRAEDGGAPIQASGTLSGGALAGVSSGRLGAGSLSGQLDSLGVCAQLQQSGGQGTFSYAFDAAATSGTVQFFREAYSVPDSFRVIANGATLYDSGGLVSGSATVSLQLNGTRVLFVTVNAPNAGTAWQLNLGCPV